MLDDDHAIEAPAIHDVVAFLHEHLPLRVHLVIAGCVDPRLPFARVRARGQLAEIRAAELHVTPDEALAFFREVMSLALTAVAVAALEDAPRAGSRACSSRCSRDRGPRTSPASSPRSPAVTATSRTT